MREDSFSSSWLSLLCSFLSPFRSSKPAQHPETLVPALEPTADMMRALFGTASTIYHLKHQNAFLSVPDYVLTSSSALGQLDPLLSHAGLSGFRGRRRDNARAALLALYQLQHCYGIYVNLTHEIPDLECEKYNGRPVHTFLSIQLESDKGDPIDLLILHGMEVTRPEFFDVVRELFADNDKIRLEDYLRSAEEHTYATSRGAAQIAKVGVWTDFLTCIPRFGCPISKHIPPEFTWKKPEEEHQVEGREEL